VKVLLKNHQRPRKKGAECELYVVVEVKIFAFAALEPVTPLAR